MADKKEIARYFLGEAFSTGKLAPADEWVAPNWDTLGMLQQLGIVPTPGQ